MEEGGDEIAADWRRFGAVVFQHRAGRLDKSPPPAGIYEGLHRKTTELLKQDPVVLSVQQREAVGTALRTRLDELGAFLIAISVSGQHVHMLLKVGPKVVRKLVGTAKMHAWFELRKTGWKKKLWGKRGKYLKVRDRQHQLNVFYYILRHAEQGAWVWRYTAPKSDMN